MQQITSLTNAFNQSMIINSIGINNIQFDLSYYMTQNAWFYSVNYDNINIKNQKLYLSYNMLDKLKNVIPFGIYVKSLDGGEPLYLDDFIYPRIQLFLLNSEEIENIHDLYFRSYIYEF